VANRSAAPTAASFQRDAAQGAARPRSAARDKFPIQTTRSIEPSRAQAGKECLNLTFIFLLMHNINTKILSLLAGFVLSLDTIVFQKKTE
jgi:hypothetical protein